MHQQEHPQELPPKPEPAPRRSEWEKLKTMTWKDRVWYIWAYYKIHMFLGIIALFLLQVVATSLYSRTFNTVMHCMIINCYSQQEINLSLLEEDFAQYLNLGKKEIITAESSYITYGDDATELSYVTLAKISALVFSKDLDVIIGDQATIEHFSALNGYVDLETELPPDVLALVKDRLFYAAGEDQTKRAYAIDISGTAFASHAGLGHTPPLLGIISNSERKEYSMNLIRYIFAP